MNAWKQVTIYIYVKATQNSYQNTKTRVDQFEKRVKIMKEENLPVNSGILNQVGVIGPQGWSHHLHNQVFGQVGEGSPQLRGSFRLKLRLASQKLGNIDIGEACLLRYLTIRLARLAFHTLELMG